MIQKKKKRNIIKGCMNRWKPDLICIQETKLASVDDKTVKSVWNLLDVDWLFLPANSTAGGIIICWKKDLVDCIDYISVVSLLYHVYLLTKPIMKNGFSLEYTVVVMPMTEKIFGRN